MSSEKRNILVTGASGFVGCELLRVLTTDGDFEIYGLHGKGRIPDSLPIKQKFEVDISSYETLKQCEKLKGIDVVVHAAGLAHQFGPVGRKDFWHVNVDGTENICRLAQKIGTTHLVLISSVAVYGDHGDVEINESFQCKGVGDYAESKLESEKRAIDFCKRINLKLTILRPATVIGEGDRGNLLRLITTIDRGRFVWIGSGINKKTLIHKTDIARGIIRSFDVTGENGTEIYNLTGEALQMNEIVRVISETLVKKNPKLKIPESLIRGILRANKTAFSVGKVRSFEKTLDKWLSNDIFSGDRFCTKFEFKPEIKIHDALTRQVKYYLAEKNTNIK